MRFVRALKTLSAVMLISSAAMLASVSESVTASSQCDHEHHHDHDHDDDSDTDYKHPHIHAKPDRYVRPYSSSQGIRGDFDPYNVFRSEDQESDYDRDHGRNMYDEYPDEPEE